jgi:RNA polymerase sigma-70 factor (ECF subfamily)
MGERTPDSAETDRLLQQAANGDQNAFAELFDHYRPYLDHVIALRLESRLRSRVDASDVVQETQLEVFRRLGEFLQRRPMPFRLWLRKTALERLLKLREYHVEAKRRTVQREVPLPERSSLLLARRLFSAGSTPSQRLSRRELARRVNQALAQLPDSDREVLLMRHFEGLPYEEIGLALEIAPAAARKRYGRALLRVQKLLIADGLLESEP